MRHKISPLLAVLIFLATSLGYLGLTSPSSAAGADQREEPDGVTREDILALAVAVDISEEEAAAAFADTTPLIDFMSKWASSKSFGAVWVTYEGGYEVHARATDGLFEAAMDDLEVSLGRHLVRHYGGASYADQLRAVEVLRTKESNVAYSLNTRSGTVDIFADSPALPSATVIDPAFVRQLDRRMDVGTSAARAGADVLYYNGVNAFESKCTSGFIWGGYGITGFATAGHCPDANGSNYAKVDGQFSAPVNQLMVESCPGPNSGDYQMITFTTPMNESELFVNKTATPYGNGLVYAVAGGYYDSQPTKKIGKDSNGVNGSNNDVAHGFESFPFVGGAPGDCGSATFGTAFRFHNNTRGGDSGGPTYLAYNGQWYLASVTSAGSNNNIGNNDGWGTWVGFISMPGQPSQQIHVCTFVNPCS